MKKMEDLIKEINEFSKLAKQRELSKDELKNRQELRNQYRKLFKKGFEQKLQNIKIVNGQKSKE